MDTLSLPLNLAANPPRALDSIQWSTTESHVLLEVHDHTETTRYIATPEQLLALWGELGRLCAELIESGLLPPNNEDPTCP